MQITEGIQLAIISFFGLFVAPVFGYLFGRRKMLSEANVVDWEIILSMNKAVKEWHEERESWQEERDKWRKERQELEDKITDLYNLYDQERKKRLIEIEERDKEREFDRQSIIELEAQVINLRNELDNYIQH